MSQKTLVYWYYNITTVVLHKTSKNTYIHYYIIYYYDGRRYLGRHEGTVKTVTTNCGGAGWRGTGVTEADPKDCYRRRVGTRACVCVWKSSNKQWRQWRLQCRSEEHGFFLGRAPPLISTAVQYLQRDTPPLPLVRLFLQSIFLRVSCIGISTLHTHTQV